MDEEFTDLIEACRLSNMVKHPWRNLFAPPYRYSLCTLQQCRTALAEAACDLSAGCSQNACRFLPGMHMALAQSQITRLVPRC